MEKIILSEEDYANYYCGKPDYQGREGVLYKEGIYLYKFYRRYGHEETKLEQIIKFQSKITRTKLPKGAIYFKSQFVGAKLHLFHNALAFKTLYHDPLKMRITTLKELSISLQEFTNHGLVLTDLFHKNLILDEEKKVQIIDTDGDNIRLLQDNEQIEYLLNCFRKIILECCETEIETLKHSMMEIPHLDSLNLSYEDLEELMNYINLEASKEQNQKILK